MRDSEKSITHKKLEKTDKLVTTTDPPNCGQIPVAMPMPMVGSPTAIMAAHPQMPMTQVYAPHISVVSLLLLMLAGSIVFRIRYQRKRLAKRCPHCGIGLERWADRCGMCNKSIFVYPTDNQ
ncbi:MAG: hypothetical protein AB1489_25005 [Acidobacteriota bacterium]